MAEQGRRRSTVGVTLVFAAAGLLFATSAETARGTQLRSDRGDAADLVRAEQELRDARSARVSDLQARIDARLAAEAEGNGAVRELAKASARLAPTAGLQAVSGPALTVTLDDAPRSQRNRPDAKPDDLVVHQQDVQAVVNALWLAGAEAMTLMDQRVISTSAVQCAGNTLFLHGVVYSPPYRITAVGDPARMKAALEASKQVQVYLQYVAKVGLVYQVEDRGTLTLPAYSEPLEMRHASVPRPAEVEGATPGAKPGATPSRTATGTAGSSPTP